MKIRPILESLHFLLLVMKFRPKIEKIIKKNKKMSSAHNFRDFDDENHNNSWFWSCGFPMNSTSFFVVVVVVVVVVHIDSSWDSFLATGRLV